MELLDKLAVRSQQPPLAAMRDTGAIRTPDDPVAVLMLVIDFDSAVTLHGIVDFLGNATGRYARETVAALRAIGCPTAAAALDEILRVAAAAGMTRDALQKEAAGEFPLPVSRARQLRGGAWAGTVDRIQELCDTIDFDLVTDQSADYVEANRETVTRALRR